MKCSILHNIVEDSIRANWSRLGWLQKALMCCIVEMVLIHWGQDNMAAISQTTDLNAFSWMKTFLFWFEFHWSVVQFGISQHWSRYWLGVEQATSHYMNQCLPSPLTYIWGFRGRWVFRILRILVYCCLLSIFYKRKTITYHCITNFQYYPYLIFNDISMSFI